MAVQFFTYRACWVDDMVEPVTLPWLYAIVTWQLLKFITGWPWLEFDVSWSWLLFRGLMREFSRQHGVVCHLFAHEYIRSDSNDRCPVLSLIIFSGTPALYNSVACYETGYFWARFLLVHKLCLPFLYSIFFPTGTDEYHFGESATTLFSGCR